ncbi:MAG: HAMP domain-containing histidine kinase [Chloroflexi bacterium]|nr:HAMP domain-containing histidine kinase [Chloroflexota bacterium]
MIPDEKYVGGRTSGSTRTPETRGKSDLVPVHRPKATAEGLVEQARSLQSLLDYFTHVVAHDIRTPLTIVLGQAQMIQRVAQDPDVVRHRAEAIVSSARKMSAMIADLVDATRIELGTLQLDKQSVGLHGLTSDVLRHGRDVLDVKRVRVEISSDAFATADPERLERILLNLLANALKYSPPETEVLVRTGRTNKEITIVVSDLGTGFAPEDLPHIFDRSYAAKGVRQSEGLGLGLYHTKVLVEAHGGRISVESGMGKGCTFYVALPVA